jgi:hypothetical protein
MEFMDHLFGALLRGQAGVESRTRVAMVASAIGGAVTHPLVADLDDATLKAQLLDLSLRFLNLEG